MWYYKLMKLLWGGMQMNMNIWQNIIMGFVAGFAELLPVSGEAHRALVRCMMGIKQEDAVFALIIHIACLVALLHCCREDVKKLSRTRKLMKVPPKRRISLTAIPFF